VLRELGAALQASDPARGGLLKAVGALSGERPQGGGAGGALTGVLWTKAAKRSC
jgi:hypothetical protein